MVNDRGPQLRVNTRSEWVNVATDAMWEAMQRAVIGWPHRGEDQNINRLERMVALLTGKEAALFVPTTNCANLLAMMALCRGGEQVIMEHRCHLWWVEQNIPRLTAAAPRMLPGNKFGEMALDDIESAINEQRYGMRPKTAAVCLENTHNVCGGVALSPQSIAQVVAVAHRYGARVFIDGARLFNAAAAHQVSLREMTADVDALSLSLNKGLGAPFGAMLCGSKELIASSRKNHAVLGSHSIHKVGFLAAAAIVALETMVDRLPEDHARARNLAESLAETPGLHVDLETVQTNIVRVELDEMQPAAFVELVEAKGVGVLVLDAKAVKFITHYGITDEDIVTAAAVVKEVLAENSAAAVRSTTM